MFTPKANSKQKRAKNVNVFQIGLTENRGPNCSIRGPIFAEPNWKNSSENRWPSLEVRGPSLGFPAVQKSV